ncbi:MAG: carboxypeptidase regulatory-like domain-containing protein [Methanosphaera sp.]|nr:carboxypeptidase regulatory-like domain-containing protein [Methanosphaera sp.]
MVDRGFGLELESTYGDTTVAKSSFDPNFWNQAESVDFKLNDEPITRSGGSRMNKRARAGIMKPSGSTEADADLQQLTWYFRGFLDNYVCTEGDTPATGHTQTYIHEFYGGEGKELPSFRGIAVYDMLKKYLYGMLEDSLKLEVSNEGMTVSADWIYKTEKAGIIGQSGETFTRPDELTAEQIFIMFYDVSLKLNDQALDGVSTAFSFEGKNNHDVDSTIGLGSRYPQKRAQAGKRENSLSITTTLTSDTVRSILNAQYGEVNALEPSSCKLLQLPLELNIAHCEDSDLACKILFPKCTVRVEYDMSGVDAIEATLTLDTLGSGTVTLEDGTTEVETDMYVELTNYVEELSI